MTVEAQAEALESNSRVNPRGPLGFAIDSHENPDGPVSRLSTSFETFKLETRISLPTRLSAPRLQRDTRLNIDSIPSGYSYNAIYIPRTSKLRARIVSHLLLSG